MYIQATLLEITVVCAFCRMVRLHISHTRIRTLQALKVNVLPWPFKSPDVYPNEHTWDVIDRIVRRRGPVMFQQLFMDGWSGIAQRTCLRYVASMRPCCRPSELGSYKVLSPIYCCDDWDLKCYK